MEVKEEKKKAKKDYFLSQRAGGTFSEIHGTGGPVQGMLMSMPGKLRYPEEVQGS